MEELTTMAVASAGGFGLRQTASILGFAMSEYAKATAAGFERKKEIHEAHEKSMEKAKGRGGEWLRIGLFALISVGLLAGVLAGFYGKDLMVEKEVARNFLLWSWSTTKFIAVEGVPVFIEFKKGLLALMAFALGASIK